MSQVLFWTDKLYGYLHCCLMRDSKHFLLPSSALRHLVVVRLVFTSFGGTYGCLVRFPEYGGVYLQNVATHALLYYTAVP